VPRTCSVCRATRVVEIDVALLSGTAYRTVAKQFEASESAIFRHRAHLPVVAEATAGACGGTPVDHRLDHSDAPVATAGDVLKRGALFGSLDHLQQQTKTILADAIAAGRQQVALQAVRESRANLELLAKLTDAIGAARNSIDLCKLDPAELNALLRATFGELSVRERRRILREIPALADLGPETLTESPADLLQSVSDEVSGRD
jgi:hypothetical protein